MTRGRLISQRIAHLTRTALRAKSSLTLTRDVTNDIALRIIITVWRRVGSRKKKIIINVNLFRIFLACVHLCILIGIVMTPRKR